MKGGTLFALVLTWNKSELFPGCDSMPEDVDAAAFFVPQASHESE